MVLNSNRRVNKFEPLPAAGTVDIEYAYNVSLEQVQADPYATVAPPTTDPALTAPTQISGLWGWWDFSDATKMFTTSGGGTNVASNNDPIGRIEDKSGLGNHALNATSAQRPWYKTGVQNSKSAALFAADGGVDHLSTTGDITSANMTVIAVIRTPSTITAATSYGIWSTYHSAQQDGSNLRLSDAGLFVGRTQPLDGGVIDPNAPAVSTNYIIAYTVRSTTPHRRMVVFNDADSTEVGYILSATPSSSAQIFRLGAQNINNGNHYWQGHLMEVVAYEGAISDTDVGRLIDFFQSKWAIT